MCMIQLDCHRYQTDRPASESESKGRYIHSHSCLNKMLILPRCAKMLNDRKPNYALNECSDEYYTTSSLILSFLKTTLCMTLNFKMTSIILSESSLYSHHCVSVSSGRAQWAGPWRDSYVLLHVLRTFVFNQVATEQRRPSSSSKLCSFFRSSLIKSGLVFMVSGSVYIVFSG